MHSFLPPAPNVVAQALLQDGTLRALSAERLAQVLHVDVSAARQGMASIIGMMNATAGGRPDAALKSERSLSGAIGPFMSLDQAMSRYGSHMGRIVRSPTPSPMYQPDVGSDRQFGAGALAQDLYDPATTLLQVMQANGCAVSPQAVSAFQTAFNAHHAPPLVVDGKYGPATATALAAVIAEADASEFSLYGQTAPAPCRYGGAPAPGPAPIVGPVVAPAPMQASMFASPWFWAAGAAAAAVYVLSKKRPKPKWLRAVRV